MKKMVLSTCLCFGLLTVFAQRSTYDLASFVVPKGWKKEMKQNVVVYTVIDQKDKTWCRIAVYKSVASKGSVETDFSDAWQELVATPFKTAEPPESDSVQEAAGWKIKAGGAGFTFNNAPAIALLSAFTGYNRTVDILATTNAQRYIHDIESFTRSLDLQQPTVTMAPQQPPVSPQPASTGNYAFTTTNFDDGWTSTVQPDWVAVTKPGIKVLIHYPNAQADQYNSVLKEADFNAWNILVAPKYKSITNLEWKTIQSWQSISFMEADAVEKSSGQPVQVVIFKKHLSNGTGRYLEVITANKNIYERELGTYHNTEFDWDKWANLQYRNKFAVAATDLPGTWTANDYASLSYYYVNSGNYAGATATSIATSFTFFTGNRYESEQASASGVVGNQQFNRQVYKGQSNVSNWQLTLTNRFKGATEHFECQFEAIKNGRILLLTDNQHTTYSLVRK